jgi:hypothetical protein
MHRRAFLGMMAGGLLAAPLAAEAQEQGRCTGWGFSLQRCHLPRRIGPLPAS